MPVRCAGAPALASRAERVVYRPDAEFGFAFARTLGRDTFVYSLAPTTSKIVIGEAISTWNNPPYGSVDARDAERTRAPTAPINLICESFRDAAFCSEGEFNSTDSRDFSTLSRGRRGNCVFSSAFVEAAIIYFELSPQNSDSTLASEERVASYETNGRRGGGEGGESGSISRCAENASEISSSREKMICQCGAMRGERNEFLIQLRFNSIRSIPADRNMTSTAISIACDNASASCCFPADVYRDEK